jgi:UDP-GlcNAc:undecaprenyl-phosphate/decaprenyl-phosphate GlcNAc-1-phosphate transferase
LPEAVRLVGSFALSMAVAALLVPFVIRLALRTGFMDLPAGYKGHLRATPYLGGVAVVAAGAIAILAFGDATSRYGSILIWALVLFVLGTVDDKRNLSPGPRLLIEIFAGAALWNYGLGWTEFGSTPLNILMTIVWVVGVVNAFNLMDNMDGAAASVAGVSALGVAALCIIGGDVTLAVIVLAVAGACAGFLPYNLASPSRIFLGDGGSMPLGFVVAGAVMAAPGPADLGFAAILAVAPLVGLPILDTTLVVISRRRGGRPILSGGRDHLTHRLRALLGSPRLVAFALATAQAGLCITGVLLTQAPTASVVVIGIAYLGAACSVLYTLESRIRVTAVDSGSGPIGVVSVAPRASAVAADELAA